MDGTIIDEDICHIRCSLHTNAPILKETEERDERILDANYSKVNINKMIDKLKIKNNIKQKKKAERDSEKVPHSL